MLSIQDKKSLFHPTLWRRMMSCHLCIYDTHSSRPIGQHIDSTILSFSVSQAQIFLRYCADTHLMAKSPDTGKHQFNPTCHAHTRDHRLQLAVWSALIPLNGKNFTKQTAWLGMKRTKHVCAWCVYACGVLHSHTKVTKYDGRVITRVHNSEEILFDNELN